jgi:hypothetical protein
MIVGIRIDSSPLPQVDGAGRVVKPMASSSMRFAEAANQKVTNRKSHAFLTELRNALWDAQPRNPENCRGFGAMIGFTVRAWREIAPGTNRNANRPDL